MDAASIYIIVPHREKRVWCGDSLTFEYVFLRYSGFQVLDQGIGLGDVVLLK